MLHQLQLIKTKELLVNNVVADASSSSTIKVNPIVSLKAKASSTGDIYYYNNPKNIEKKASSAGTIKLRNKNASIYFLFIRLIIFLAVAL